ncbi:hypothetical protein [Streptomyces sp. enrichment culture]|uniref:hypothetical protein n=1 Tax=Streptomyces sp. enrichment culture TaxID=1795815 RepID=UPI003F545F1C
MTALARVRAALARRAARRRADRALLRLARENCGNPQCPTCRTLDHLAHHGDTVHTDDRPRDERHPDYCHTCKGFCGSKAHR